MRSRLQLPPPPQAGTPHCRRQPGRLRDIPPRKMPIPPPCLGPPCVFSPLKGVFLVVVVRPLRCCRVVIVALRRDPIQLSSRSCRLQCALFSAITKPSESSLHPSGGACHHPLIGPTRRAPRSHMVIDRHCPWAVWINPLLQPTTTMANDIVLLRIPSPSSHAIISCPGAAIAGASTLLISSRTSSTR